MVELNRHLIIGMGEIGKPIFRILSDSYPNSIEHFDTQDTEYKELGKYDFIHICFGYKAGEEQQYKEWVEGYQKRFLREGGLTIIHATVEPGMSRKLNAIHSPVIGQHPNMEPGIRTFIKFFGGERASEAAEYFRKAGLKVYVVDAQETTELMKILDTTFYGLCIEYTKEVKRQAEKYGVPFEVWSLWTQNYNLGYQKLGYPEYTRPNLVPLMQRTGGHCVLQNCSFLDSEFSKLVLGLNDKYYAES